MNSRQDPWSERVVDGACLVFASWTLACHAAVATGGSLWRALAVFAALGVAALVWRMRRAASAEPVGVHEPGGPEPAEHSALRWSGLAVGALGAWLLRDHALWLWWLAVALLGAACACFVVREAPRFRPAARGHGLEAGLWGLALVCVVVTLVAHRVDLDDAFYVNLAAAAADAPAAALLAEDTLHGVPGLPLHHPVYLVHSWELWNGAFAALTGVTAIASFHFVSAALAALLAPLAWARLFRRLTPGLWLVSVAALLWVLLAAGDTHRWYGNFAFVRMWQGKSIFLTLWLPLVWSGAIDFARRPSWGRGLFLAAAQVASVGVTSTALWAAPAAALSAALCALPPGRAGLRTLALTVLTSLYVLTLAFVLRGVLEEDRLARRTSITTEVRRELMASKDVERARAHAPGRQLEGALTGVTGDGALRSVCLVALLAGWAFVPSGLGRRFACAVPLVVLLTLMNPYWTDATSRGVVGNSYWRTLWVLPLPVLLAFGLTLPLGALRHRRAGQVLTVVAFALFALVPERSALSRSNGVRLGVPRLKVPEESYRRAQLLLAQVPPGSVVVAPRSVSAWLATFQHRVYPLLVRDAYLRRQRDALGLSDVYLRLVMTEFCSGHSDEPDIARHFARGLERYGVAGVFLEVTDQTPLARSVLRDAGFEKQLATLEYEIWTRH